MLFLVRKPLGYGGYTHFAGVVGDGSEEVGVVDPVHAAHMAVGGGLSENHLPSEVAPTRAFSATVAVGVLNMLSVGERTDVSSASLASAVPARLPLPVIA